MVYNRIYMLNILKGIKMKSIIATMALMQVSQLAYSQDAKPQNKDTESQEKMVVVGSRVSGHLDESTENVTIISNEELVNKNYIQLNDYLRSEVGLYVKQDAAVGGTSSLFMRGTESDHVLVLVNGMRVTDPSTPSGAFNFTQLTVFDVERVEIVRGPKSVIYGSQAIGGVINIILKDKSKNTAKMAIEAGSFNTLNASLQLSESYKDFNFFGAAGVNFIDTNEDADETSGVYNPQKSDNEQAMLRMTYTPKDSLGVDLWFTHQKQNSKQVNNTREDEHSELMSNQFVAAISDKILNKKWEYKLSGNYVDYDRDSKTWSSFSNDFYESQSKGRTIGANFDNVNTLTENQNLLWGLVYREDKADFGAGDEILSTYAAYLEYRISVLDRLNISVGDRYENYYSHDTSSNNWKVSMRGEAVEDYLFIRGSAGTGFRMPSLMSWINNPELDPETSFSWDAGLDFVYKWYGSAKWTFFRNDFKDLITYDYALNKSFNTGKAMTYGNETEFSLFLHEMVTASGGYTYLIAKNVETGDPLLNRPQDSFFANLDFSFPWVHWQINYNAYSKSAQVDGTYTEGYELLNTTLTFSTDYVSAWFRVMNVLDEEYEITAGYPQLGRSYYFGVEGKF